MGLRFGFDLGSNSLGWCVLRLDASNQPCGIIALGSRIISSTAEAGREPKGGESLAKGRRIARGMRRRRDRFLLRRNDLMAALIDHDLMPDEEPERKALESLDPYELRRDALDLKLDLHHVGRALFHLHQRRGFKSNRKTEAGDAEAGAIKEGIASTKAEMKRRGVRTFGELLALRHDQREPVRARNTGEGTKVAFDLYPDRKLIEKEFDAIWDAQARHHPDKMTSATRNAVHGIMFRQRPLRPVNPGRCSLYTDEPRAPRAWPLFQRFRIFHEVGSLRIARFGGRERRLTVTQRDLLVALLMARSSPMAFEQMRAKLKLDDDEIFTIEGRGRDGFDPDLTAAKLDAKKFFNKEWRRLDSAERQFIAEQLLETEDESEMVALLCQRFDLDEDQALAISRAALPSGYARFGRRALSELVAVMESESTEASDPDTGEVYEAPLTYDEAVARIGLHHSHRPVETRLKKLPYYGDVLVGAVTQNPDAPHGSQEQRGRIANPTVHIGLNQLRRVVNMLIETYGSPDQVVLELGRELKQNAEQKLRDSRQQRENEQKNRDRNSRLAELGVAESSENRLRLRLFEEFDQPDAICVYSGERISIRRLFSPEIEIDHILPFSQTLDDGFANKILCTRQSNRIKGQRTPFDAFGHTVDWDDIVSRSEALPQNKRWRFAADAMERMRRDGDFIARQLIDTQYLGRMARAYMEHVCGDCWVIPGRMTAMLRGFWGLNSLLPDHNYASVAQPKNRLDHRHHALDAFVAACTDRGLLNKIARSAGRAEVAHSHRLLDGMPDPWPGFRDELAAAAQRVVVSHKPDHGRGGQLHEATALGTVQDPDAEEGYNHVVRKNFLDLTPAEIDRIRDLRLRSRVLAAVNDGKAAGQPQKQALSDFARSDPDYSGIRRVRLLKKEADTITIRHGPENKFTKNYTPGSNLFVEIFETPDGKWHGEGVTVFDANQSGKITTKWPMEQPDARLIMRLYKGDMIQIDHEGEPSIMKVVRLNPASNRIWAVLHQDAGDLAHRESAANDPFRYHRPSWGRMKQQGAKRVRVDEVGRVWPVSDN